MTRRWCPHPFAFPAEHHEKCNGRPATPFRVRAQTADPRRNHSFVATTDHDGHDDDDHVASTRKGDRCWGYDVTVAATAAAVAGGSASPTGGGGSGCRPDQKNSLCAWSTQTPPPRGRPPSSFLSPRLRPLFQPFLVPYLNLISPGIVLLRSYWPTPPRLMPSAVPHSPHSTHEPSIFRSPSRTRAACGRRWVSGE